MSARPQPIATIVGAGRQRPRPWLHVLVGVYERLYRLVQGLEAPEAEVGPALSVAVRWSFRRIRLAGGVVIHPGDRIGILHLNNARVVTLHADGRPPLAVGLAFRRDLFASLRELAALASGGGRLAAARAFAATTIFHRGLRRLGFETERRRLVWPGYVAAYQRALLTTLHPAGAARVRRLALVRAERLWIAREALLARYGAAGGPISSPTVAKP